MHVNGPGRWLSQDELRSRALADRALCSPAPACQDSLGHPSIPSGTQDWPQGQDGGDRGEVETCVPAPLVPSPASFWVSPPDNSPLKSPFSPCGAPLHLVQKTQIAWICLIFLRVGREYDTHAHQSGPFERHIPWSSPLWILVGKV